MTPPPITTTCFLNGVQDPCNATTARICRFDLRSYRRGAANAKLTESGAGVRKGSALAAQGPHVRSGSHLGQVPACADSSSGLDCIQNVIQAISRSPYFHEDISCVTTQSFDVASAAELQCSKSSLVTIHGGCRCRTQSETVSPLRRSPLRGSPLPLPRKPSSRYSSSAATTRSGRRSAHMSAAT